MWKRVSGLGAHFRGLDPSRFRSGSGAPCKGLGTTDSSITRRLLGRAICLILWLLLVVSVVNIAFSLCDFALLHCSWSTSSSRSGLSSAWWTSSSSSGLAYRVHPLQAERLALLPGSERGRGVWLFWLGAMSASGDRNYAGGWSESGFDASIPVWDGHADTLREFRRTVRWWLSSIDLERTKNFNLAARFAMKQRGAAKLRALEFQPDELAYTPARETTDVDSGEVIQISPAVYDIGIMKILDAWDEMVGRTVSDRRGELREKFYLRTRRGPSESVANFALRYRNLVSEMKTENVTLDDAEAAWFFKQKLNLTEVQKQLLETTLSGVVESYADTEREAIRLFKRIHGVGSQSSTSSTTSTIKKFPYKPGQRLQSWQRPSSSSASSGASSTWSRSSTRMGLGASAVNVTEMQEIPEDAEVSAEHEVQEIEDRAEAEETEEIADGLQGLEDEIEVMAAELEQAAQEGCDAEELDALEEQLDGAVEALVTLREARTQIATMRKAEDSKVLA